MGEVEHMIAVYRSHVEVASAVTTLKDSWLDIKDLAILGQDYPVDHHLTLTLDEGHRPGSRTQLGDFWRSMSQGLRGSAIAFVPHIGQVMIAGWLVDDLERASASGNQRVVMAVLIGIGVPGERAAEYEVALKGSRLLLVIRGNAADLRGMQGTLAETSAIGVDTFSPLISAGSLDEMWNLPMGYRVNPRRDVKLPD